MKDRKTEVQLALPATIREADPGYYARFLIHATLPHSKPDKEEEFKRWGYGGAYSLTLMAPKDVGVPYGKVARHIVAWLSTEAVRRQRVQGRRIRLPRSFVNWCHEIRIPPITGKNGTTPYIREQLHRLMHLTIHAHYSPSLVRRDGNPRQRPEVRGSVFHLASEYCLWPFGRRDLSEVEGDFHILLDEEFYEYTIDRPLPYDLGTLQRLKSPFAIDIYMLLVSKAPRTLRSGPDALDWKHLYMQFGAEYKRERDFRAKFKRHLEQVLREYPARVTIDASGLILYPYEPAIPPNRSLVAFGGQKRLSTPQPSANDVRES